MEKISVTIAARHEDDRKAMAALLAQQSDFIISSIVSDNFGLINSARKQRPDVIVMDICLEEPGSLEMAPVIRRNSPQTALILLCPPDERIAVDQAFRVGISGYLLAQHDFVYLALSIRSVFCGVLFVSPTIKKQVLECFSERAAAVFWALKSVPAGAAASPRDFTSTELQIFRGIILGQSDSDIASGLNISAGSVRNCICKAKKKSGLQNRTQIIVYVLSAGLITLESVFQGTPAKTDFRLGAKPGAFSRKLVGSSVGGAYRKR